MTAPAEPRNGGTAVPATDGVVPAADGAASVGSLLSDAERVLAAGGIAEPRREALMLWAAVTRTSPGHAWLQREVVAGEDDRVGFAAAVARRAHGAPVAYAAGTAAFRSIELAVDSRVLIPRPETEGLVQHVLDWCRAHNRWGVAVDIGTGSGCIALSLAAEGAFDRVIGTDLSLEALAVARSNLDAVAPRTPVTLRHGDLLWAIGQERADVVVSNPPYVSADEWSAMDAGVRDYEPRLALVGGVDGLAHLRGVLRLARSRLREGGLLALELDCRRAGDVLADARALGWASARVEFDLFGRERYLLATWGT
ncbi:MAG: peptide chain release factor N(5)-glutamine methyltransferase [Gemmatimonadota bacterium]|nr:peptide chain release factor N(5)-glutamine methyltransferase [Gemmatimonadota bacterium]